LETQGLQLKAIDKVAEQASTVVQINGGDYFGNRQYSAFESKLRANKLTVMPLFFLSLALAYEFAGQVEKYEDFSKKKQAEAAAKTLALEVAAAKSAAPT
jgi:hypothetical protein